MSISGLIAGGGIPEGDNLRTANLTLTASTTTDGTLLSESSGSGGVVYGFTLRSTTSGGQTQLNSIKVTIDGASERTLSLGTTFNKLLESTTAEGTFYLNTPINYKTSLTYKINYTTGSVGTGVKATLFYSLK